MNLKAIVGIFMLIAALGAILFSGIAQFVSSVVLILLIVLSLISEIIAAVRRNKQRDRK